MVGKYRHLSNEILCSLPKNKDNICCKKVLDTNNSAYVDSFFSYLSSKLNKQLNIKNNIDDSIIGGIKMRIDNIIIDNSLSNKLMKLKNNLKKGNTYKPIPVGALNWIKSTFLRVLKIRYKFITELKSIDNFLIPLPPEGFSFTKVIFTE